jgi:hypothetical protein
MNDRMRVVEDFTPSSKKKMIGQPWVIGAMVAERKAET